LSAISFWVNGEPTFKGREWNGYKIEGLIPNSRMVQGFSMMKTPKPLADLFTLTPVFGTRSAIPMNL
jgi:hypothetical protein